MPTISLDSWVIAHHDARVDNDSIIREVEGFIAKTGMAESTLGRKALNDGKAIARLREGKRMWPETIEKLRAFIAAETPSASDDGQSEGAAA